MAKRRTTKRSVLAKYNKDMPEKLFVLARKGLPLYEICAQLKITELAFRKYCETYKAFMQAWDLGRSTHKDDFIYALEKELKRKTKTRKVTRHKKEYRAGKDADGNDIMILYKTTEETDEREGDSLLIIYALKCLSPEKWRDNNIVSPESEDIIEQSKKLYKALMECEAALDPLEDRDAGQVITSEQTPQLTDQRAISDAELVPENKV